MASARVVRLVVPPHGVVHRVFVMACVQGLAEPQGPEREHSENTSVMHLYTERERERQERSAAAPLKQCQQQQQQQEHHGRPSSTTTAAATRRTSGAAAAATGRAPHPVSVEQGRREHGRPAEGTLRAARGSAPKDDTGGVLPKLDHPGAPGSQAGAGADCREPREVSVQRGGRGGNTRAHHRQGRGAATAEGSHAGGDDPRGAGHEQAQRGGGINHGDVAQ
ncbi:unnamed protein product [Ectocarpus sp. 4 AP-2014]